MRHKIGCTFSNIMELRFHKIIIYGQRVTICKIFQQYQYWKHGSSRSIYSTSQKTQQLNDPKSMGIEILYLLTGQKTTKFACPSISGGPVDAGSSLESYVRRAIKYKKRKFSWLFLEIRPPPKLPDFAFRYLWPRPKIYFVKSQKVIPGPLPP